MEENAEPFRNADLSEDRTNSSIGIPGGDPEPRLGHVRAKYWERRLPVKGHEHRSLAVGGDPNDIRKVISGNGLEAPVSRSI
jgi:hypothetical protein